MNGTISVDMAERKEPQARTISISTGTIFRTIVILLVLGFLYFIRDIVALVLAGLFLAILIDPFADFLERYRMPRSLAALVVYAIGLTLIFGALVLVLPPVLAELKNFFAVFAPVLSAVGGEGVAQQSVNATDDWMLRFDAAWSSVQASGVSAAVPQVVSSASAAFSGIAATIVVLILAFYLVAEKNVLLRVIAGATPEEYQPFVVQVAGKVRDRLGYWLRGQLLLMGVIFVLTYIALLIIGVPYALILALIAGLLEIVPLVGPLMSGVPAVILALTISPVHALITAGAYILIQVIEGNVLVPKVMQKATGINPIISLVAVLIGWRIGGMVGAILSIPLANAAAVFIGEITKAQRT